MKDRPYGEDYAASRLRLVEQKLREADCREHELALEISRLKVLLAISDASLKSLRADVQVGQ